MGKTILELCFGCAVGVLPSWFLMTFVFSVLVGIPISLRCQQRGWTLPVHYNVTRYLISALLSLLVSCLIMAAILYFGSKDFQIGVLVTVALMALMSLSGFRSAALEVYENIWPSLTEVGQFSIECELRARGIEWTAPKRQGSN